MILVNIRVGKKMSLLNLDIISEILKVAQIYPQGVPLPDTASLIISGQALATLEELKKLLEDQNNGIKSNFVKTI
jgi:hypothetical protein